MINLIPIEEKKKIRKDFYYRLLIVFLILFVFLAFVSLVAMVPAYVTSVDKKISINKKLEIQKNEVMPEIDQQAQIAIKDLDNRLGLLEKARENKYVFSKKVIDEIISKKVSGIKINRIFYENDSLEGRKVNITGLAQNREQLLLFRRALENDSTFKNVDLPISNFVKGQDIQFNLDLISI
jgi:Tfp pilus assembly protein PilN